MIGLVTPPPAGSTPSYNVSSKQLLINLINAANFQQFQASDLSFGVPAAAAAGAAKNTAVLVSGTGTTDRSYKGSVTITYDRLDLNTLFSASGALVELQPGWTTTLDLLPALNEAYGLGLNSDDIVSAALVAGPYPKPQSLTAKATSFGFIGAYNISLVDYNGVAPADTLVAPYRNYNVTLGGGYVDGTSKMLMDATMDNLSFTVVTNEEVTVASRIAGPTGSIDSDNTGHYMVGVAGNNYWTIDLAVGVPATKILTDLYDVAMVIEDVATSEKVSLHLVRAAGVFKLQNADASIVLNADYSAVDGSIVEATIDLHAALAASFPTATQQGTSAFGGSFTVDVTATKKFTSKPVVHAATSVTISAGTVNQM